MRFVEGPIFHDESETEAPFSGRLRFPLPQGVQRETKSNPAVNQVSQLGNGPAGGLATHAGSFTG